MGYWVSKLKSIPTHFNWYFFLVLASGDNRQSGSGENRQ